MVTEVSATQNTVQPANHEWQGNLARATQSNALFSLYLAIQMQPGNVTSRFKDNDASESYTISTTERLNQLNHYRRASLAPEPHNRATIDINSQLVARQDTAGLSLWQAMHPDPLALKNDATYLDPEIVANCSLATQIYLKQSKAAPAQECDALLLSDIIEGSGSLLHA